jgi:hypothetical protein
MTKTRPVLVALATTAAIAGPTIRAAVMTVVLSDRTLPTWSAGTNSVTNERRVGFSNADARPNNRVMKNTTVMFTASPSTRPPRASAIAASSTENLASRR